jgi:hypothetical protein
MSTIRYVNHNGDEIDLTQNGYEIHANDLRDYAWTYALTARPDGLGSSVKQFGMDSKKSGVMIGIIGEDNAQFAARANALLALTEPDVLANVPGKLYLDAQYIRCYVVGVEGQSREVAAVENKLTILSVDPFWVIEKTTNFFPISGTITGGKKFNLKYPYRYGTGYNYQNLYNDHYADTPAKIVFFGPASNPSISIGGQLYGVTATLYDGERIEIDQLGHTVQKIGTTGAVTNLFDARDKAHDVFAPLPYGESAVQFYGTSPITVTLYQKRSAPLWQ